MSGILENDLSLPLFKDTTDAIEYMYDMFGFDCMDNERIADLTDEKAMEGYRKQQDYGCCGFFDEVVLINNVRCTIGCNYGH